MTTAMEQKQTRQQLVEKSARKQQQWTANRGKTFISLIDAFNAIVGENAKGFLRMNTEKAFQNEEMKKLHLTKYPMLIVLGGKTYNHIQAGPFTVNSNVKPVQNQSGKITGYRIMKQASYTEILTEDERNKVALMNVDSKYMPQWEDMAIREVEGKFPTASDEEKTKLIAEIKAKIVAANKPAKQNTEQQIALYEYMYDMVMKKIHEEYERYLTETLMTEMKTPTMTARVKGNWAKAKGVSTFYQTDRKSVVGKDSDEVVANGARVKLDLPNIFMTLKFYPKPNQEYSKFKDIKYMGPVFDARIYDATTYPTPRDDITQHQNGTLLKDEKTGKFDPINPDNITRWFTPNSICRSTYISFEMTIGNNNPAGLKAIIEKEFKAIIAPRMSKQQDDDDGEDEELSEHMYGKVQTANTNANEINDPLAGLEASLNNTTISGGSTSSTTTAAAAAAAATTPARPKSITKIQQLAKPS